MADFQIVTNDNQAYTEGSSYFHFKDLGHDSVRLQSFKHEGDFIALNFEHDLQLLIPEHRIEYIATTGS
ncbi:hypothetical protein [Streptomyces misionensis]|uniref:hypothetical protein n=1 Tax=Streptomyces misionensis TaxID=67331 RepID=UPI00396BC6F2